MVGETRVRTQIRSCAQVVAHGCLERQERRHGPVERTRQSQTGGGAGGHEPTLSSLQRELGPGAGCGPAPEFSRRATDEDVLAAGVQHPVVSFARIVVMSRNFDETLIETQVVPDGVLPALSVLSVVGKVVHDELVDSVERKSALRALTDRHHDEGVITERRLLRFHTVSAASTFLRLFPATFSTSSGIFTLCLAALFGTVAPFLAGFLRVCRAQLQGRRRRLRLTHLPFSSPQQTSDAERRLVE